MTIIYRLGMPTYDQLYTAVANVRRLHVPSDMKVHHWCSRFGGGMEEAHNDAPNYCEECGTETAWPCDTLKAVGGE